MRPERLELRGFASFREPTEVDLSGAELFVLAGPTGAGKSSIIDAMVFALYGSVPRYDDRRLVAPVISQGKLEARVRLTFLVEGARYAATRVVRRTKTGATTKEARLERVREGVDPEVLAGTADELTTAVEELLGLTFDHFTKTVVLPQGDFQEFLHAKPKDRQDLLIELLDLDVYRRVAQAARRRADAAGTRVATLLDQLDGDLADATEDALVAAKERVAELESAEELIDDARPRLDELREEGRRRRDEADRAAERRTTLGKLVPPEDIDDLAEQVREADRAVTDAADALEAAVSGREQAEAALADLPTAAAVRAVLQTFEQLPAAEQRVARATEERDRTARAAAAAVAADDEADRAATAATDAVASLERRHLAHALVADLEIGTPCPVCRVEVTALPPEDDGAGALDTARGRQRTAETELRDARSARREAERAATTAAGAVLHAEEQLAQARARLEDARAELSGVDTDDLDELRALAQRVQEATAAVEVGRTAERSARQQHRDATERRERLERQVAGAWEAVDGARMAVSDLDPPTVDRDDLGAAWATLTGWRDARLPELDAASATATERIEEAVAAYRLLADELRSGLSEHGLEDATGDVGELDRKVAAALATARSRQEQVQRDLERAEEARRRVDEAKRERELAGALGRHLNARNFEQWLLNRALRRLVVGASAILLDLSSGGYSLDVSDDGTFLVTDHRSADEQRPAKTLSGGETFLASLSLALALAEHVAELAAEGSARLEALFLDEGFGTLDADTLDTVAVAIEELGSRGRMVGLITHVRDLAERVPVRFEVRKTATTSTIERVER